MARKSKNKHQGPSHAKGHHSIQQPSVKKLKTQENGGETVEKAKMIKELVAGAFSLPYTATYPSELEISDFDNMLGPEGTLSTITETHAQAIEYDQNLCAYNETQTKDLSATMEHSWDSQSHTQQGYYGTQNQTPSVAWENQASNEEPFNGIEGVFPESKGGQWSGSSHK